jgi:hypothetical protein
MNDLYDTDRVTWSERQAALLRRAGALAAAATCLLLAGCTDHPASFDNRTLFNPYFYSGPVPENRNPLAGG